MICEKSEIFATVGFCSFFSPLEQFEKSLSKKSQEVLDLKGELIKCRVHALLSSFLMVNCILCFGNTNIIFPKRLL